MCDEFCIFTQQKHGLWYLINVCLGAKVCLYLCSTLALWYVCLSAVVCFLILYSHNLLPILVSYTCISLDVVIPFSSVLEQLTCFVSLFYHTPLFGA